VGAVVRITGVRETVSALRKVSRAAPRIVTDELKAAAEPVAVSARAKISRYPGAKTGSINPRVAGAGNVFVTQGARKVTGLRGDFGALQMRRLSEALDENEAEVRSGVEKALDRIVSVF